MGREARHGFQPDHRAPGAARRFTRSTLEQWELSTLADTAELLVSEVVTNAVGHASSGGEMVVSETGAGIRVEVSDYGAGVVQPRDAGPEDVTGRGMAIVAALSSRWGVATVDDGKAAKVAAAKATRSRATPSKTVWFELDR